MGLAGKILPTKTGSVLLLYKMEVQGIELFTEVKIHAVDF
jgi:hypothetical protein